MYPCAWCHLETVLENGTLMDTLNNVLSFHQWLQSNQTNKKLQVALVFSSSFFYSNLLTFYSYYMLYIVILYLRFVYCFCTFL